MAIQKVPTEVNAFVKGLITEASPLTFPENASVDEQNFILNRDGSRRRRLGIAQQGDVRQLGYIGIEGRPTGAYQWKEAGGITDNTYTICQIGVELLIYSTVVGQDAPQYHSNILMSDFVSFGTENIPQVDFTSVDGVLVVAHGKGDLLSVEYVEATDTFEVSTFRLKIRDTFGVQTPFVRVNLFPDLDTRPSLDLDDLLDDENSSIRPWLTDLSDDSVFSNHIYNLRNQSWGRPRTALQLNGASTDTVLSSDPIVAFLDQQATIPANGDIVASAMIDYAEQAGAPPRFIPIEMGKTPLTNSSSPRGSFIIDALSRGVSRSTVVGNLVDEANGDLDQSFKMKVPLPLDTTPDGARCVTEYGGRVWYGGFSGTVTDGDSRSPRMSSYVLYSQLVKSRTDIDRCYQKNDPTYEQEADLLATDGGFIRLDGAYGIKRLEAIGNSLIIFATNGIWAVSGGTDEGFTAEAFIVKKISDKGILAPKSVVVVDSSCMFWGDDGIYAVSATEVGGYQSQNISSNTIQKKYESIPIEQRRQASGIYDKYDNTARWVYGERVSGSESYELVFNLDLSAYTFNVIKPVGSTTGFLLAPVTVPPFKTGIEVVDVEVGTEPVVIAFDQIVIDEKSPVSSNRETFYFTALSENRASVGFTAYTNERFADWSQDVADGIDAEAYLITGYGPQGDFQRRKQVSRITTYMEKTEDSYVLDGTDIVPANQSGCILQARWDWHNTPSGNRWGRENQIYKNKRLFMPEGLNSAHDDGESVVTTKTKLRGHGKTLSLLFKSEPEKDCKILGWSMVTDVSTNV